MKTYRTPMINDLLRRVIGVFIVLLGFLLTIRHQLKLRRFQRRQDHLRKRYQIRSTTPVLEFGPELEKLIETRASRVGTRARFAETSGSTSKPKRILYTPRRLRYLRLAYIDFFARCCWWLPIKRKSLYVFSALADDSSLTSLLLSEQHRPNYLSSLQAPYRMQSDPALKPLLQKYSLTALQLWILTISNPGVLYATNPSTLSHFLDSLTNDWHRSAQLVRDWYMKPEMFTDEIHSIAHRIDSRFSQERLRQIAGSNAPLPLSVCAPGVEAYICWVGGYVKPFLDRLKTLLPPDRYRLIPMYSMSTETVQTVTHFEHDQTRFVPLADGVLYEFIDERLAHNTGHLLTAGQLQVGKTYTMVVSDSYGLRRYHTGDVFECKGFCSGLPDLHFIRRRDLEYSFTGEKLTGLQVSSVLAKLREEYRQLVTHQFLACVPSQPDSETSPRYKLAVVNEYANCVDGSAESGEQMAQRCDELLCEVNSEYKNKRESGRLGAIEFISSATTDFIERMSGTNDAGESQFKFLPLYRRRWEQGLANSHAALNESSPQQVQGCLRSTPSNQLAISGKL